MGEHEIEEGAGGSPHRRCMFGECAEMRDFALQIVKPRKRKLKQQLFLVRKVMIDRGETDARAVGDGAQAQRGDAFLGEDLHGGGEGAGADAVDLEQRPGRSRAVSVLAREKRLAACNRAQRFANALRQFGLSVLGHVSVGPGRQSGKV